jgi:hypothetical protein
MRKLATGVKLMAVLTALMLFFALPFVAFADNNPEETTGNPPVAEQPADADTKAATDTSEGDDEVDGAITISGEEVPLAEAPRAGWSLFNLLATALTVIIALGMAASVVMRREKSGQTENGQTENGFGLSVFSIVAAIFSTALFASTANFSSFMVPVDSYTIAHISMLAVAVLCAVTSTKRLTERTIPK